MKILITNDDGIEAQGIKTLEKIIKKVYQGAEIFIYAPAGSISGAGRSMTFGSEKYVKAEVLSENRFKIYGTPADCVEIGCRIQKPIDLVFSGINHGFNLGQDFYLSGTIQAAQHAVHYFNIPSVALSAPKFIILNGQIELHVESLVKKIKEQRHLSGLISVNFPKNGFYGEKIVSLGNYLAIGNLRIVSEERNEIVYDLLGPMELMEQSNDLATDVGAVKNGFTVITLHDGALF